MKHVIYILPSLLLLVSCSKEIGIPCGYDIDCSPNMNRTCDSVQPGGYCLILGCESDECPSEAVCVEFTTPCPEGPQEGEPGWEEYEETCNQIEPNRGRSYCLRKCKAHNSCRADYMCVLSELDEEDEEERTSELPVLENTTIIDFDVTNPDVGFCVPSV